MSGVRLPFYAWVAYHPDWSGFRVFGSKLAALEHAVENHMQVVHVRDGDDPQEIAAKKLRRPIEDLIEASSLGSPDAKAARSRVSDEQVQRVLTRAQQIQDGQADDRDADWVREAAARRINFEPRVPAPGRPVVECTWSTGKATLQPVNDKTAEEQARRIVGIYSDGKNTALDGARALDADGNVLLAWHHFGNQWFGPDGADIKGEVPA